VVYATNNAKDIYAPVNSVVWPLCSQTGSCDKCFVNCTPHYVHSFSQQWQTVFLPRISSHSSRPGPQSWVSNCRCCLRSPTGLLPYASLLSSKNSVHVDVGSDDYVIKFRYQQKLWATWYRPERTGGNTTLGRETGA
jgi:hypothetical protein